MEEFIRLIKYIIVAIIQGIAEILPISSSGHMKVAQMALSLPDSELVFEIFLHFASLIAIIFFFRKKLWQIVKDFFFYILKHPQIDEIAKNESAPLLEKQNAIVIKQNFKLGLFLIIATIPAAIAGILLEDFIKSTLSEIWIIGVFLLITSAMLYLSTLIKRNKNMTGMTFKNAFIIGLFQIVGIFPGISRSGSCLTGGATQKIEQSDSAEFAFLLAIPIMLGTTILSLGDIGEALANKDLFIPYFIAFLVTLVTTYFALKLILAFIRKQKLSIFSLYCLIAGITFIILDLTNVL